VKDPGIIFLPQRTLRFSQRSQSLDAARLVLSGSVAQEKIFKNDMLCDIRASPGALCPKDSCRVVKITHQTSAEAPSNHYQKHHKRHRKKFLRPKKRSFLFI